MELSPLCPLIADFLDRPSLASANLSRSDPTLSCPTKEDTLSILVIIGQVQRPSSQLQQSSTTTTSYIPLQSISKTSSIPNSLIRRTLSNPLPITQSIHSFCHEGKCPKRYMPPKGPCIPPILFLLKPSVHFTPFPRLPIPLFQANCINMYSSRSLPSKLESCWGHSGEKYSGALI